MHDNAKPISLYLISETFTLINSFVLISNKTNKLHILLKNTK